MDTKYVYKTSNTGFTLVELMIVIAIVAILAAIATCQVVDYKRSAANAKCAQEVTNCTLQATLLLVDNITTSNINHTCQFSGNTYVVSITGGIPSFDPFSCAGGGTCQMVGRSVRCE